LGTNTPNPRRPTLLFMARKCKRLRAGDSDSREKTKLVRLDAAIEDAHRKRMQQAGLPEVAIRGFLSSLRFVFEGGETSIPESSIAPAEGLPHYHDLAGFEPAGRDAVHHTAIIKLNGGLGTGMGLSTAKSLLPVRPGLSFLELIARQVLWAREHHGAALPLVLMNSYRTRDDSLAALAKFPELEKAVPLDFLQRRVPRVDVETGAPIEWSEAPHLEWCPPGHGDLYPALADSGMLDALRSNGIRYAFISNSDNLGGVLDLRILGWLASNRVPFAMEVAERTAADRKGGHLAIREGRLILREGAQCPEEDLPAFQDIERHHYFNTNNLWLDLDALAALLEESPEGLSLPVIRNERPVCPTGSGGPRCIQLESAMGAAIECFDGAEAICVPRDRFAPVKTTNDLLLLWSDAYRLSEDLRMVPVDPEATRLRKIELDPRYYKSVEDLRLRFPNGAPSLVGCRRFSVTGDHRFGEDVSIVGDVSLCNDSKDPVEIASGTVLGGD
jgi:UTP--glucose-1-phosphate uridylyltransferase